MEILSVDVVDAKVFLLMIETASSVNIVDGLGTPRISVGAFMDT